MKLKTYKEFINETISVDPNQKLIKEGFEDYKGLAVNENLQMSWIIKSDDHRIKAEPNVISNGNWNIGIISTKIASNNSDEITENAFSMFDLYHSNLTGKELYKKTVLKRSLLDDELFEAHPEIIDELQKSLRKKFGDSKTRKTMEINEEFEDFIAFERIKNKK